jgi:Swt1-like HEPN
MMPDIYSFVFRGLLATQATEATGLLPSKLVVEESLEEFSSALSIDLLDPADVENAQRMAVVYVAITAFEQSARAFVRRVLIDQLGDEWWSKGVSSKIQTFAQTRKDDEVKAKWHGDRGENLLDYIEMGHLPAIIQQNWSMFEAHIQRADWATAIFSSIERSRNVIMHSGQLSIEDAERVGINIRDWSRQVGS